MKDHWLTIGVNVTLGIGEAGVLELLDTITQVLTAATDLLGAITRLLGAVAAVLATGAAFRWSREGLATGVIRAQPRTPLSTIDGDLLLPPGYP